MESKDRRKFLGEAAALASLSFLPSDLVPVQKNPPEAFHMASTNPSAWCAWVVQPEFPVSEAKIVKSAYVSMLCSVDFQVSKLESNPPV
jgi:hypothetical protein